jgi:hypothetical protein
MPGYILSVRGDDDGFNAAKEPWNCTSPTVRRTMSSSVTVKRIIEMFLSHLLIRVALITVASLTGSRIKVSIFPDVKCSVVTV